MLLTELLLHTEYQNIRNSNLDGIKISYLAHDSRKATYDTVFVCICGALQDGHNYAASAYEQGCRIFVCERELDLPQDAIILLTADSRIALALMSAALFDYPAEHLYIIGITGTKGKTTTALLIKDILCRAGYNTGYIGSNGIIFSNFSYDSINTTPESYDLHYYFNKMLSYGIKYLVMEVSSQALYHSRVHGIKFDTCVFTNLTPDHIGGAEHPTFEHYKECKMSLFRDFNCECIVYNADDSHHKDMIKDAGKLTRSFAVHTEADFSADNISLLNKNGYLGVKFNMHTITESFPLTLRIPGEFNVYNALAAAAVCKHIGVGDSVIISAMEKSEIKGRFEVVPALEGVTIIIDFAHNETSLRSVLSVLKDYSPRRLVCLFGSVGGRTKSRRAQLGRVAAELADFCILTSDHPDFEPPLDIIDDIAKVFPKDGCPYIKIPDREKAIKYAVENAKAGDVILLAGKGHEDYQLIEGKKIPMRERELVLKYAQSMKKAKAETPLLP